MRFIMIQAFLDSFKDLTPILWASQICGLVGLVFIFISYQFKKKTYFILASISMLFFFLEQALAGLFANTIVTTGALIRNVVLAIYVCNGKEKSPDYFIYILIGLVWISEFILFITNGTIGIWDNYLPPILWTIATVTSNHKNYYVLKLGMLVHEIGFLVYYAIYALPFSVMRQAILAASIIVSIIVMLISKFKKSREKSAQ